LTFPELNALIGRLNASRNPEVKKSSAPVDDRCADPSFSRFGRMASYSTPKKKK
jgi:hypothetical protein